MHLLNDTELRSWTNIKTYKHNSFWIFFFVFNTLLSWLQNKNKISIKQVKGLQNNFLQLFFFFFWLFIFFFYFFFFFWLFIFFFFVIVWSDIEV